MGDENSPPGSPSAQSNRNLAEMAVPQMLGPLGMINRTQFIRIIVKSLHSLGYMNAASALESESGVLLESREYTLLLSQIISGRWDDCIATINTIDGLETRTRTMANFLVWKEHFLELLGSSDGLFLAINVLRNHISPLNIERRRIHKLAGSIISLDGIVTLENQVQQRRVLCMHLFNLFPPCFRPVPNGRLEHLVAMGAHLQMTSCFCHELTDATTLYEEHQCYYELIPSICIQTLDAHQGSVLLVQFSNNGKFLVSSSGDLTVIIWTIEEDETVSLKHILEGHERPVFYMAWSPQDTILFATDGLDSNLWDVDTGTCLDDFKSELPDSMTAFAWFPNSEKIVCSDCDKVFLRDDKVDIWEGKRSASDLAVTPDGRHLICICFNREIQIWDLEGALKERTIFEKDLITSLSLSRDGKFLLVNLDRDEIHLWNVDGSLRKPHVYRGHKEENFRIRSCFGGPSSMFIASCSEDSHVYIWQRQYTWPIKVLSGHSDVVNCVSWNPTKPHMLASASKDCTIRIWVSSRKPRKVPTLVPSPEMCSCKNM